MTKLFFLDDNRRTRLHRPKFNCPKSRSLLDQWMAERTSFDGLAVDTAEFLVTHYEYSKWDH